jgi:DNA (cytosine-5)-methyltransferase 1
VKPRLLDLFCKAGGAGRGYADAGFEVIGVDIEPQPRYPFEFLQADALTFPLAGFDVVHASPPCKVHTRMKRFAGPSHGDLIPATRRRLVAAGIPYVIENVPGAPLRPDLVLCGSMFGLGVRRHRLFESNVPLAAGPCRHAEQDASSPGYPVRRYHSGRPVVHRSPVVSVFGRGQGLGPGEVDLWKKAMDIDWMIRDEMAQAIPPAYTAHIGRQLVRLLEGARS